MDIVVCFALFLAAMLFCLVKGFSLAWALLFALVLFFALGLRSGYGAKALVKMAWSKMPKSMIVLRILFFIGLLTGLWRSCGTIAFFIYHGIRVITPSLFILVAFLLTVLLSYALGTSFGVASTAGVVLMALARSGGVSEAVSGGGLVSMLTPFLMIPLAALYTGILEGTGALTQAQSVLERSAERIGRFPTMILLSLLAAMVLCNQTIVVMMEHQLIGAVYAKDGAEHEELAMDIANSGVTIAGLIPWCIACAVPLSMLGVGVEALPYACLLYLIPLCYLFTKRFFFPAKSKGSETPV